MTRQYQKLEEDFKSGAVRLVFETGKLNAQEAQGAEVNQGSPRVSTTTRGWRRPRWPWRLPCAAARR